MLSVTGGDDVTQPAPGPNPRPEWSRKTLDIRPSDPGLFGVVSPGEAEAGSHQAECDVALGGDRDQAEPGPLAVVSPGEAGSQIVLDGERHQAGRGLKEVVSPGRAVSNQSEREKETDVHVVHEVVGGEGRAGSIQIERQCERGGRCPRSPGW